MSITVIIIIAILLGGGYLFVRHKRSQQVEDDVRIEKVKAATYIVCPRCGLHMEIEITPKDE